MITVLITQDATYIYKFVIKKNELRLVDEMQTVSYIDIVKSLGDLTDLFLDIKDIGTDEIHLILPDEFFDIDLKEYSLLENISEENKNTWLKEQYNIDLTKYYYASPFFYHTKARKTLSTYFINKQYCDLFINAAKMNKTLLISIQSMSIAYLNALDEFNREHILLEHGENSTVLISYNPLAGIFKQTLSNEKSIEFGLSQYDLIAAEKFKKLNVDVKISVVPFDKKLYDQVPENRKTDAALKTASISNNIYVQISAGAINTMLENSLYSKNKVSAFFTIGDANVLPDNIKKTARQTRLKNIFMKGARLGTIILSISLMLEVVACVYFSHVSIPESFEDKYQQAQQNSAVIKKEVTLIKDAKGADQHVYDALLGLVSLKPNNVGFSTLEIGQNSGKPDADKWIQFTARTTEEPVVLRDFADKLNTYKLFKNVTLESINTANANVHSGKFLIGRGSGNKNDKKD